MTMHVGLAANAISTDAVDARLALAGLVIRDQAGVPRNGVFPSQLGNLIGPRSDMKVDIFAFAGVITRGATYGAILYGNDGTIQVTLDTAPDANSRIDHIYVKHPDVSRGDASGPPFFGVVKGDAGPNPVAKAVPDGAVSWGTVQIPSTATTTSSANVVITPTYQFTTTIGSPILYRTFAAMSADAASYAPGTAAIVLTNLATYVLGIIAGVNTWAQRGRSRLANGMDNTSGGLVSPGASSTTYGARTVTLAAFGTAHIHAQVYVKGVSGGASSAGTIYAVVDGAQVSGDGLVGRIHTHGKDGFGLFDLDLDWPLAPGSHTISVQIVADAQSATIELWEVTYNYSVEV